MHPTIYQLERARRATVLVNGVLSASPVDACLAVKRATPGVPRDSVG